MADKVESTERLSRDDRDTLERKVDINVQRQVEGLSKQIPDDPVYKPDIPATDRTQKLIKQYDDYIAEIDKILAEIGKRCQGLVYRVEPETEYDCSAAIEALFEGYKDTLTYDDYKKILELEAALSREMVAEGGQLDGLRLS